MIEERMEILKMIEVGQIEAEEAAMLLAALDVESEEDEPADQGPGPEPPSPPPSSWAKYWLYPLWAGTAILVLGVMMTGLLNLAGAGGGWSAVCGWLPIFLGLGVVLLAFWSQRATWLHLKITEQEGRGFTIGFPIPLTLAAWVVRIAQPFVPRLQDTGVDDLIIALRDAGMADEPLVVDVQDEEDGERVQIYIG